MRYNAPVVHAKAPFRTLPAVWLLSDARNDATLERALARLPRGSGFVYRHYHLCPRHRRARFRTLARLARGYGHVVVLADSADTARAWGADGVYGSASALHPRRAGLLRIATAHGWREIGVASRLGADAVMLSPVMVTRSHPGGDTLGPVRFGLLARSAPLPVIALGGMDARAARSMCWHSWAAIDGLSSPHAA